MKIHLLLAYLVMAGHVLAQSSLRVPSIPTLPAQTSVDLLYSSSGQTGGLKVSIYKGDSGRVITRHWPSGLTTYVVRTKGWRFYTDPTAPQTYQEFVMAVPLEAGGKDTPDFPELEFMTSDCTVSESNLDGHSVSLVTAPPAKPNYTDASIKSQVDVIHDPAERTQVEKALREAQTAERAKAPEPPSRAWIDASTGLPLRVEIHGQTINYSYHPQLAPPTLPPAFIDSIKAKFQTIPSI